MKYIKKCINGVPIIMHIGTSYRNILYEHPIKLLIHITSEQSTSAWLYRERIIR